MQIQLSLSTWKALQNKIIEELLDWLTRSQDENILMMFHCVTCPPTYSEANSQLFWANNSCSVRACI